MNLRITGTSKEAYELVELLPKIVSIQNISKEYPNRGSQEVRVYVDCFASIRSEGTLGRYMGDYLIIRNGQEIEFFADNGVGYTQQASEAGIFNLEQVKYFNAIHISYDDFVKNRNEYRGRYIAISVVDFLIASWRQFT